MRYTGPSSPDGDALNGIIDCAANPADMQTVGPDVPILLFPLMMQNARTGSDVQSQSLAKITSIRNGLNAALPATCSEPDFEVDQDVASDSGSPLNLFENYVVPDVDTESQSACESLPGDGSWLNSDQDLDQSSSDEQTLEIMQELDIWTDDGNNQNRQANKASCGRYLTSTVPLRSSPLVPGLDRKDEQHMPKPRLKLPMGRKISHLVCANTPVNIKTEQAPSYNACGNTPQMEYRPVCAKKDGAEGSISATDAGSKVGSASKAADLTRMIAERAKAIKSAARAAGKIGPKIAGKRGVRIQYTCRWGDNEGCGRSFARPSHLQMHLYTHTGERPYGCSLCSKSFGTRGALTKHTRIHTAERPFSCESCGKTFTQRSSWRRHNIHFHGAECKPFNKAGSKGGNRLK